MPEPAPTSSYETAMLYCGVALFIFALGLIIYLVRKGKSFVGAVALIPISIIMIGFPLIQSAQIGKDGITFNEKTAQEFSQNPGDPSAKTAYDLDLTATEKLRAENPAKPLSPQARSSLELVAQRLAAEHNLPLESRLTLARTQLVLGQTNGAMENLRIVTTAKPQLVTNPKLLNLIRPNLAVPAPSHP